MRAHPSRSRSSVIGYLLMVLGLIILAVTRSLFSRAAPAIALQGLAVALMVWARITFGLRSLHLEATPTAGGLVTHGPYRWLRHPIYAAVIWFATGGVIFNPLTGMSLGALGLIVGGAAIRMRSEEQLLRQVYPAYADYAARTKRVVPLVL